MREFFPKRLGWIVPTMAKVGRFLFFDIILGLFPLVSDVVESRLVSVKSRSVFVLIFTVLAFC